MSKQNNILGIAFIQESSQVAAAAAELALDPVALAVADLLNAMDSSPPSADAVAQRRTPKVVLRKRKPRKTPCPPLTTSAPPPPQEPPPPPPPPSLHSKQLLLVPMDILREIFDIAIAPTITAPTALAQTLRQHMYRRMFLTLASSELSNSSSPGISPDALYNVLISTLQQLGLNP